MMQDDFMDNEQFPSLPESAADIEPKKVYVGTETKSRDAFINNIYAEKKQLTKQEALDCINYLSMVLKAHECSISQK